MAKKKAQGKATKGPKAAKKPKAPKNAVAAGVNNSPQVAVVAANAEVRLLAINALLPAAGAVYAGEAGTNITVKLSTNEADVEQVWAKIHVYGAPVALPAAAADLTSAPYNFVALTDMGGGVWQKNLPVPAGCPCSDEWVPGNNLSVTFAYKRTAQADAFRGPKTSFKFICKTHYTVDVGAWACPWFAFITDPDYVGPEGEDILTHQTARVRIPQNATAVTIGASGYWRHQARDINGDRGASGPEGLDLEAAFTLLDARYQTASAANGHPQIQTPDTALLVNTLVCVFEFINPATASKILPVRRGPMTISSGDLATIRAIHFGMWDGLQWNKGADEFSISNSGTASVTLDWTVT